MEILILLVSFSIIHIIKFLYDINQDKKNEENYYGHG